MIMKKFKSLAALLLTTALVFSLSPVNGFANDDITEGDDHLVTLDEALDEESDEVLDEESDEALDGWQDEIWQSDVYVTRAEFAAMINSAFGYDALSAPVLAGYEDIPEDEWYADDMSLSIGLGYITGCGYRIAAPENQITREQAAVMLCKILRLPINATDSEAYFADITAVSNWAKGAVLMMGQHGYMAGDNGWFRPKSNITNDEAVQLITNVYGTIIDEGIDAQGTVYENNVTIRQSGAILKNAVIKGDLFITEGVSDGQVWLDTVQIEGRLLVAGGGENSVHIKDIIVGENVLVDKPSVSGDEAVRFHVTGSNDVIIALQGIVKDIIITEDMMIAFDAGNGMKMFNLLTVEDELEKPTVLIASDAIVQKITAFVPAEIQGDGIVSIVEAHADGVVIDSAIQIAPNNIIVTEGAVVDYGTDSITSEEPSDTID